MQTRTRLVKQKPSSRVEGRSRSSMIRSAMSDVQMIEGEASRTSKKGEMESFASKVQFGNASRFDPMMEERGGWIAGEAS